MSSASHPTDSLNVNAYIHQAGAELGMTFCVDGSTHRLLDDYSNNLRAAIKLVVYIFIQYRPNLREYELDGLIGNLKLCRYLPSPDRDFVAVIDVLLRNLLASNFDHLIAMMADRKRMEIFFADLCERVRHEGEHIQAITRAIDRERESYAKKQAVKHTVEAALASDAPVEMYKIAFLRKQFMPANREAALSEYERARSNDALFRQQMSGEPVSRQPNTLLRPGVGVIQRDLTALKDYLERAVWVKEILRGGIITVDFSCIHGLYLTAALAADGRMESALEGLTGELFHQWDELTNGDGHIHHWDESQCSWSGSIESTDAAKRMALLLEFEGRAMREKYVRSKDSESLPTFTLIEPFASVQRKDDRNA